MIDLKFMFYTDFVIVLDVNECISSPCLHASTCIDHVNYYTCVCSNGYTGYHCETSKYEEFFIFYLHNPFYHELCFNNLLHLYNKQAS